MRLALAGLLVAWILWAQTPFRVPGVKPTAAPSSSPSASQVGMAWDETPAPAGGLAYRLAHTPIPAASVRLYLNGLRLRRNVDYTVSGDTITFISGYQAMLGFSPVMVADYTY